MAAHPHVRGEDGGSKRSTSSRAGSPPRAWGGRGLEEVDELAGRLTPTCVGRTRMVRRSPSRHPAHPHVRGEDARREYPVSFGFGSPPRAWGGQRFADADGAPFGSPPRAWGGPRLFTSMCVLIRLTPTCVGRTSWLAIYRIIDAAHPHVRGEDAQVSDHSGMSAGSPPRAWGGPRHPRLDPRRPRLTPTCVGRTVARACRRLIERLTPTCVGRTPNR